MIVSLKHQNTDYKINLNQGITIGIPIQRINGVKGFGIHNARYHTYENDGFIGNKNKGGSCNLETITFTPHGNGTHTECFGHISLDTHFVNDHIVDNFYFAKLVTAPTIQVNNHLILDFNNLDILSLKNYKSLIIRSLPNNDLKKIKDYSNQATPFISADDMKSIVEAGIEHLIIDLPSVDPEWDGGKLAAHHIFWNYPDQPRKQCSITEFAYIPNDTLDGDYLLKLNIANFVSDAAPSKPILYPLITN